MKPCDLRNSDLRNSDLRNSDLRNSDLHSIDLNSSQFDSLPPVSFSPPNNIQVPKYSPYPSIIIGLMVGGTGWIVFEREQTRLVDTPLWYWSLAISVLYSCLTFNGFIGIYVPSCYSYWYKYLEGLVVGASGVAALVCTHHLDWHNLCVLWAVVISAAHLALLSYRVTRWMSRCFRHLREPPISHPQRDPFSSERPLTPV